MPFRVAQKLLAVQAIFVPLKVHAIFVPVPAFWASTVHMRESPRGSVGDSSPARVRPSRGDYDSLS